MSLRTVLRAACLALALALLVPFAPAARAGTPPPADGQDPWYIFSYGPSQRYREILDRYGNPPAAMDGVDARRLEEVMRLYDYLGDGESRTLGYSLYAKLQLTPEEQALLDGAEEGNYVEGLTRTLESAFMKLDGTLLFDFAPDTSFGIVGDRYVSLTTQVVGEDGVRADEFLLADLATGERHTPLPGRYINWFQAFGDGYAASTCDFTTYGGDYDRAELVLMDAAFNVVKTVPCESAYLDTWLGERIALVHTIFAGARSTSALNAKGELIAGPLPYSGYISEHGGVQQVLMVYDAARTGVVDKATGEIAWRDSDQSAPRGGLVSIERSQPMGNGMGQTMSTIKDTSGKVIVPERVGTASFSEASPLLFSTYGDVRTAAVFSRTGEPLGTWEEGVINSGLLNGRDIIYVVTPEELLLIEGPAIQRIPMPCKARYAWVSTYGDLIMVEYYDESDAGSQYYTAMLSADRKSIQPSIYTSIYPVDYDDPSRGFLASKQTGRRTLIGVLDAQGREVIPCRFTQLYADDRGELFHAAAGRFYGLVDAQGNWVLRRSEMRYLSD